MAAAARPIGGDKVEPKKPAAAPPNPFGHFAFRAALLVQRGRRGRRRRRRAGAYFRACSARGAAAQPEADFPEAVCVVRGLRAPPSPAAQVGPSRTGISAWACGGVVVYRAVPRTAPRPAGARVRISLAAQPRHRNLRRYRSNSKKTKKKLKKQMSRTVLRTRTGSRTRRGPREDEVEDQQGN